MLTKKRQNDKVYKQGQIIIKTLDAAVCLVRMMPVRNSDLAMKKTYENIETDLMSCIIELASVCSGSDDWNSAYCYISESGVTVPEELYKRMRYFETHLEFE